MSNLKQKLSGIFAPLTTPFKDERILYGEFRQNIEKFNGTQLGGYMVLGGNGEYLGLTEEESLKVIKTAADNKAGGKTLVAGVGRESAYATLAFIKKAAQSGADFASIITPYYYARLMTDPALTGYYERIADLSPIPLVIYNSPIYAAGVLISPEVVSKLSTHQNIVMMKNSSDEAFAKYICAVPKNSSFYVHVGRIKKLYEGIGEGAIGATLSMANYVPDVCCEAYQHMLNGKLKEAAALCDKLVRINNIVSLCGVAGVKFAMSQTGFSGGGLRLPLMPANDAYQKRITACLKEEGIII